MEIELDFSVTRPAGNLTFTSTESEAGFLLLGHLSGIPQEKIEVWVNESEGEICIRGAGDKSSLETVVGRRLRLKNELEIGSFRKAFRVPNGVVLDQIEVGFYEEEGILMILVPRSSKVEVSGRAMEEVEEERGSPADKEDDVIRNPEDDAKAPEQEQEKEREKSSDAKEDELIPEPEVDHAEAVEEAKVKGIDKKLEPDGAESSRSEDSKQEREGEPNDMETKTEIPQQKGEVAEAIIHQPDEEKEETKINQVEAEQSKIDQEEEKEKTEVKIRQEEEEQDMDTKTHLEDTERNEKREESRKQPDVPEKPSIRIKPSDQGEESINGESVQHQQSENEDETPRSIAAEADHFVDRRKEEQQTDQDHREEEEGEAHQPEQQVPRPIAELKSDGGILQSDSTLEMDKPVEAEGDRGKGPRKDDDNRRRTKPRRQGGGGGGITPPILVASAFLVSLMGLVVRFLRNQRRR